MAKILLSFFLFGFIAFANTASIEAVCMELKIAPASKSIVQWERIFSCEKRKLLFKIDQLPDETQQLLKAYLIEHAADSSQPVFLGL